MIHLLLLRKSQTECKRYAYNKESAPNDPDGLIDDVAVNKERKADEESNEYSPKDPFWIQPLPVQTENCGNHHTSGHSIEYPPQLLQLEPGNIDHCERDEESQNGQPNHCVASRLQTASIKKIFC